MKSPYDVVIKPVITEKSMDSVYEKQYTFIVDKNANKTEIRQAVESIFEVQVASVNTIRRLGKIKRQGQHQGRRPSTKKAIITLKEGSKGIEFFDSMSM